MKFSGAVRVVLGVRAPLGSAPVWEQQRQEEQPYGGRKPATRRDPRQ